MRPRLSLFLVVLTVIGALSLVRSLWPQSPFLYLFISFGLTLFLPWLLLKFWQATADKVVRSPAEVEVRWLKKTVYDLATRANISVPRVELLADEVLPRARAYAFWPQAGVIQISVAALRHWNHKTLRGVLAHEIAHLAHKDSWRSLWRVSTMIFFLSFTVLLAPQLVYFVLLGLMMWEWSQVRAREYAADEFAARVTSPEHVLHYLVDGVAYQERGRRSQNLTFIKKLGLSLTASGHRLATWATSALGPSSSLRARLHYWLQIQCPRRSPQEIEQLIKKLSYFRSTTGSRAAIKWARFGVDFNK